MSKEKPQAVWAPIAQAELEAAIFYIAFQDRRPATGEIIYWEIREAVDQYASKKLPGRKHFAAPVDWKYLKHKRWFVFYRPHPLGIEIMRLLDARRDLPRLFRQQEPLG